MNKHFFILRQPESINELKSLLLVRYSAYRQSRLHNYVTENEAGIDLDGYDLSSLHFGLFEHDWKTSRPVGYMRVVTGERRLFHDDILEIAELVPQLIRQVSTIPGEPLPIFDGNPYKDLLRKFYEAEMCAGKKVVEPSRFSIDKSVRGREVSRFMVSAV